MRLAVFSLCSNQGVAQARLLIETIKTFLSDADCFLILADARHPAVHYPEGCTVIAADDLGIPDFTNFAFRYDRHEFAAALKPFAFLHLLGRRGYTHCLYFDPDIEIFSPLPAVTAALAADAPFIFTPHILAPAEQPAERSGGADDIAIMRAGAFNLGFLGVSGTREARDRLGWWARWLRTHCVDDQPSGLFIDQKFMDLIPGLARGTRILRDPGLNLAHWNLPQRRFQPDAAGGPLVDGRPLGFFHYHGFDPATPDRLTTGSDQFQGAALPRPWLRFLADYADRLNAIGHGRIPADSYAYGRFASGVPIPAVARRLFRDDHPAWSGDPFETYEAWANLPAYASVPGIGSAVPSLTMQWLQARDPRLVRYPLGEAAGSAHVTRWWLEQGPMNGIDRRFLEPQALAAGLRPLSVQASFPPPEPNRDDVTVIAPAAGLAALIGRAQRASLERAAGRVGIDDAAAFKGGADGHKRLPGRALCLCLDPERLASTLAAVAPRLAGPAYRIFIPATELALSPSCLDALSGIDEIWAPTRFMQASLVLATTLPVIHMPVAWRFPAPVTKGRAGPSGAWLESRLGDRPYILAENDGFPGSGAVEAAVRAYASAFASWPRPDRPLLAIRAQAADDRLRGMIAAQDGIVIPEEADPAAVMAGAACVLALHRGEALGIPILRAMAGGVPVIATEYGGCTDLLTPKTGFPVGARLLPRSGAEPAVSIGAWAEADTDHAAWSLRDLFTRPEAARRRAEEARRQFETLHDPATVAARQAGRLSLVERLAARPDSLVAA